MQGSVSVIGPRKSHFRYLVALREMEERIQKYSVEVTPELEDNMLYYQY